MGSCNPAEEAGIEKGDIIVEINGEKNDILHSG
ncbi:MAG: PDZ domain-containing protein [Clostridiales bacterium]|nr:PDZ domain-containing protein [Clostridiales bacterium]